MFAQRLNALTGTVEWTHVQGGNKIAPSVFGCGLDNRHALAHPVTGLQTQGHGMLMAFLNMHAEQDSQAKVLGLSDSLYLDMLTDHRRNHAYAACLKETITPGVVSTHTKHVSQYCKLAALHDNPDCRANCAGHWHRDRLAGHVGS